MTGPISLVTTWLYVPADQPHKLAKALQSSSDAVLVDLEDAVAPGAKHAARSALADWLSTLPDKCCDGPSIWVRVNRGAVAEDLAVADHPSVAGICLPKAEDVEEVDWVASLLDEAAGHRSNGRIGLMLLVETAKGVLNCPQFARCHGVDLLQLGEQDLREDLGLGPADASESVPSSLRAARDAVVLASAAAGRAQPVAPVSLVINDSGALVADARRLRLDGFGSRAVIHPAQIEPTRQGFAPTGAEVRWAQQVVDAAERLGTDGAVTAVDGQMVDAPVIAAARTLLRRAEEGMQAS